MDVGPNVVGEHDEGEWVLGDMDVGLNVVGEHEGAAELGLNVDGDWDGLNEVGAQVVGPHVVGPCVVGPEHNENPMRTIMTITVSKRVWMWKVNLSIVNINKVVKSRFCILN
eukprot:jgi/Bigna1/126726/aug1.3_g1434